MTDNNIDYKQVAQECLTVLRGLFSAVRKDKRISTTYVRHSDLDNTKISGFGDYRCDAAQLLFKHCGIFWEDSIAYLTDEQQEQIKKARGSNDR